MISVLLFSLSDAGTTESEAQGVDSVHTLFFVHSDGMATLTDQVFPAAGATTLSVFAEGGTATPESLTVTPLNKAMW